MIFFELKHQKERNNEEIIFYPNFRIEYLQSYPEGDRLNVYAQFNHTFN